MSLSERRTSLLRAIYQHTLSEGIPPTYRQLRDALQMHTICTIGTHLKAMADAGLVRTGGDGAPRSVVLTAAGREMAQALDGERPCAVCGRGE